MLNKKKLIAAMEDRMKFLEERISRDFGGGMTGDVEAYRELKYWKECIKERGLYNIKIW